MRGGGRYTRRAITRGGRTGVLLGVFVGVLLLAQLVPIERSNPPVASDLGPQPAIDSILRRSCYDCHSQETSWPWYAWVAPVSWWVTRTSATPARS